MDLNEEFLNVCKSGDLETVKFLLELNEETFENFINKIDDHSLFETAEHGTVDQLRKILDNTNVNVNKRDTDRATAIFHASFGGKIENIKLLIDYGAKTNLKDVEGNNFYNYGDWTLEERKEIKDHLEISKHKNIKSAKK